MSNNFKYWGNRFGGQSTKDGFVFPVKQMSSGISISGPHQIAPEPNSPRAQQAKRDKEKFQKTGVPTFVIDAQTGKTIRGPLWK